MRFVDSGHAISAGRRTAEGGATGPRGSAFKRKNVVTRSCFDGGGQFEERTDAGSSIEKGQGLGFHYQS